MQIFHRADGFAWIEEIRAQKKRTSGKPVRLRFASTQAQLVEVHFSLVWEMDFFR